MLSLEGDVLMEIGDVPEVFSSYHLELSRHVVVERSPRSFNFSDLPWLTGWSDEAEGGAQFVWCRVALSENLPRGYHGWPWPKLERKLNEDIMRNPLQEEFDRGFKAQGGMGSCPGIGIRQYYHRLLVPESRFTAMFTLFFAGFSNDIEGRSYQKADFEKAYGPHFLSGILSTRSYQDIGFSFELDCGRS
nr:hypothetical protein Iba_chr07bCG8030 [Ipomoea batatas]